MKPYLICPTCGSDDVMKNGTTRRGKQNYKCRVHLRRGEALCGRQFVENPQWKPIEPDRKATIDRLLLEKISLAGIARVMKLSEDWLQRYVNRCYAGVPQKVQVQPKAKGRLEVQMDCGHLWMIKATSSGCGLPLML
jgi:insertion element IS1 protein InsB